MKYNCKLKIIDMIDNIIPSFDVVLKYKAEGSLFYKSVNIFSLNIWSVEENKTFKEELLRCVKNMNSNSREDWEIIISDIIRKEEGGELSCKVRENVLSNEIKELKQMTKKFEVIA